MDEGAIRGVTSARKRGPAGEGSSTEGPGDSGARRGLAI